jgi:hypothetical protein
VAHEVLGDRTAGLVETMVVLHGHTARSRIRGRTMTELTRVLAAFGADGQVCASEPDGASWSVTVTSRRQDPLA